MAASPLRAVPAVILPPHENARSRRYLRILESCVPTALAHYADWPVRPRCGHFFGGAHWYGLETVCPVFACAALARSPECDASRAGADADTLAERALAGIRYLCFTHDTGPADCVRPAEGLGRPEVRATKWGERGRGFFPESQCGRTIAMLVATALLLGERVDTETAAMVSAVCADYLGRFGRQSPRSGVYADTQMEENGWTALGLAACLLFLPRGPETSSMEEAAARWMFCTATVPADCRDGAVFAGGKTVAELTGTTFTMLPDFMAENHGIVHPTYTASGVALAAETAVLCELLGHPVPPHLFRNRTDIYRNLKRQSDRYGFFHPVQGMDWPYVNAHAAMTHAFAGLYLGDPDGFLIEERALDFLGKMIADNGGRLVRREVAERYSSIQDPMIMNESYAGQFAWAWLAHRLHPRGLPRPAAPGEFDRRNRGVSVHPHAGFAFHRHARGATSFSWRNTTMALPLDTDGILRIAPMTGTLLGSVAVKDRPSSAAAGTLRLAEEPDSFAVLFAEDLAQETVRRQVLFASLPDGSCLSWERFTALSDCAVERSEQGSFEVMNESFPLAGPPAGGYRDLRWPGGRRRVEARLDPRPGGDETIPLPSPGWINIDDRIGIVYAGTGEARYVARRFFRPYHAVCDLLVLSDGDRPRRARAGAAIAEFFLLLSTGERARTTAARRLAHSAGAATAAICSGSALLAGNFAGRPATASLRCPRGANPDIYAGTLLRIEAHSLRYDVPLGARGLRLCRRAGSIETDASGLAIEVTGTGALAAVNTGRRKAAFALGTGRNRRSFVLGPSATAVIPPAARKEIP